MEPVESLRDIVWMRWRLHAFERDVQLLGASAIPVAIAVTERTEHRRSLLSAAVRVLISDERVGQHPDWSVRSTDDLPLFGIQRTSAPRTGYGLCDAEHVVTGSDVFGRIGRSEGTGRPVTTAGGEPLTWTVTDTRQRLRVGGAPPRRQWRRGGSRSCPRRAPGAQSLAPRDGLLGPLDLGLIVAPNVRNDVLVLGLALTLLETQACDHEVSDMPNRGHGRWRAPAGVDHAAAARDEHDRAVDASDDRGARDLAERMRLAGRGDMADRVEARRAARRQRRGR